MNELGAVLISISPELKSDDEQIPGIYSDRDNVFAKNLGLVFRISEELEEIYKSFGINLREANQNDFRELPIPATIICDETLTVTEIFFNLDYTVRCEPSDILKALKK